MSILSIPVLLLAAASSATSADSVLLRCLDANGATTFTNSAEGYRQCTEVARYPAATVTTPAGAAAGARASQVRRGAVYRSADANGVVQYTNVKPAGNRGELLFTYAIDTCIACAVTSTLDWNSVPLRLDEYRDEITAASLAHDVDEALVRAVIHAESAFRANAKSHKSAQGLMQLIPATAERFGVTDPWDPGQNIAGGVEYLAWLLRRFDNDVRLATAGYNAGEGAVQRHGGIPPFAETRVYVDRVGILHGRYRAALDAHQASETIDAATTDATADATTGLVIGASP
ncbi:MAG: lytic transglycosylase domain-containing protein [Xanthomonadales bacterium]|nr:lytic transglycosylase domain-containing protein [Xanthomonadales bacterium]